MKYIGGYGPSSPELMILTDCPSQSDEAFGKLMTGSIGRLVNSLLIEAGISPQSCYMNAVCKYVVPYSPKKDKIPFHIRAKTVGIDLQEEVNNLQKELNEIRPNCILALGKTALWALSGKTNIEQTRGSILMGMGRKFVATYHPQGLIGLAAEFKGYYNKQIILFDMKRAYAESKSSDYHLPSRTLSVARNSEQFASFLHRYQQYDDPAVDIEAGGECLPVCIGFSYKPHEGMTVPLWNTDGISTIPDSDMVSIWNLASETLARSRVIGQNFKYDEDKLRRLGFTIKELKSDVMMKGFAINPELPKRLAFNQSLYTKQPFHKDEGMYKGSYNDLFMGCSLDACVTKEIDLAMDADLDEIGQRPFYEQFLMKLHSLYLEVESEGFTVDEQARERLLRKYIKWDEELRYKLFKAVGCEINTSSPKQVNILLWETLKLPRKGGTSEDDLTPLIDSVKTKPEHKDILETILLSRRVKKTISTYLMALPDFDGKMKTTYFLCLETGRTSTGQQEPPIRPTIEVKDEKGKKKERVLGLAFQVMTKHGDVGGDIREMLVPGDGYVFIGADSAQAEARVVFLLADDEQALVDIDARDYHALTASWFFGGTESDYSKKVLGYESPIRFAGKTLRHAGHLGAGKKRAAISVNTEARKAQIDIRITEAIADRALKIFHQKQPSIQQVFQNGIVEQLKKDRTLIAGLPFGIAAPCGGRRTFYERWGEELNRQAFSYIPQRSISDNTKCAALRIRERAPYLRLIVEAHDGLLYKCPVNLALESIPIIQEEMERPIDFSNCSLPRRPLVVPCEIEYGYNYKDLKKFKGMI